jgi:hypothetical protein
VVKNCSKANSQGCRHRIRVLALDQISAALETIQTISLAAVGPLMTVQMFGSSEEVESAVWTVDESAKRFTAL